MDLRKTDASNDVAGLLKIAVRFAREPDDHVGCQRGFMQRILHHSAAVDKSLTAPASLHPSEYGIGAALEADMQVWADAVRAVRHDGKQFPRHLRRLDAGQSHAEFARQLD